MDSVSIAAEILQNPQALLEMLERAAGEVERGLAALGRLPSARWALASEFLEGLAEGIGFASERGSLVVTVWHDRIEADVDGSLVYRLDPTVVATEQGAAFLADYVGREVYVLLLKREPEAMDLGVVDNLP